MGCRGKHSRETTACAKALRWEHLGEQEEVSKGERERKRGQGADWSDREGLGEDFDFYT